MMARELEMAADADPETVAAGYDHWKRALSLAVAGDVLLFCSSGPSVRGHCQNLLPARSPLFTFTLLTLIG